MSVPGDTTKLKTAYDKIYRVFENPIPPARPCSRKKDEASSIFERLVETPKYADRISISYHDCIEWLDDETCLKHDDSGQEVSDVNQNFPGYSRKSETQTDYVTIHAGVRRYIQYLSERLDELEVFASLRNKSPAHLDAATRLRQEMNTFQAREHARLVLLRMRMGGFRSMG
jgi:hypothetical protein